jgi:hypothetical protein
MLETIIKSYAMLMWMYFLSVIVALVGMPNIHITLSENASPILEEVGFEAPQSQTFAWVKKSCWTFWKPLERA